MEEGSLGMTQQKLINLIRFREEDCTERDDVAWHDTVVDG